MKIPFVGQAYTMPSLDLDAQNCINWFLVQDPTGKNNIALFPHPGNTLFSAQIGTQYSVRAMLKEKNKGYVVIDNKLYELFPTGEKKELGTLNTSEGKAKIIANDTQLFITDRFYGYVYQILKTDDYDAGEFVQITQTSSQIGDVSFTGTGLDDLTTGGAYTGTNDKTYRIEIQTAGTPDKFRWSDSDGATWNVENIDIITDAITLNDGVQITFENTTGHTARDYWQFSVSTDDVFYPPLYPAYQDGYGILQQQNTSKWRLTNIGDFRKIDALDFAFANARPDNLVVSISIREELWHFCEESIEVWYNTGNATFPFERRSNFLLNFGISAPYSLTKTHNNILMWLGTNKNGQRCILSLEQYQPQIVSTEAINNELMNYETVDDAFSFSYFYQGHLFCAFIFPTEDKTWVYDLTSKSWSERLTWHLNKDPKEQEYRLGRWAANCYMYFAGKHLIGDFESGNIYELDQSSYLEMNGDPIICERTAQHIRDDELSRMFLEWLIIDFEAGKGLVEGQGSDPKAMLSFSKDGGHCYKGEIWKSMGKLGETKRRAKWNRLGYARNWTLRTRISDPVYRVLLGAVGEMEVTKE